MDDFIPSRKYQMKLQSTQWFKTTCLAAITHRSTIPGYTGMTALVITDAYLFVTVVRAPSKNISLCLLREWGNAYPLKSLAHDFWCPCNKLLNKCNQFVVLSSLLIKLITLPVNAPQYPWIIWNILPNFPLITDYMLSDIHITRHGLC